MKPTDLILRCYAEKSEDDLWQAFCLDLTLAAQAVTFEEARQKLHEQIAEYVFDALAGEDREHADSLLHRKAPAKYWARYYFIKAKCELGAVINHTHSLLNGSFRLFKEPMPMGPLNAA